VVKSIRCALAVVLVGCGARPSPAPAVIAPQPTSLETTGEAMTATAPVDPIPGIQGVWEDPSTAARAHHTIEVRDGTPVVVKIQASTGAHEQYVVTSSRWQSGKFSWAYRVPSTNYNVAFEVQSVDGDAMTVTWSNQTGESGTEGLVRVR
jgi:hypothetical protein